MSTMPVSAYPSDKGYPTTDGRPAAETDWHRDLMGELIDTLRTHFRNIQPPAYVSGTLLVFHERGNKKGYVSPDVFVVRGVSNHSRPNYLTWMEGKGPDVVIELTSRLTRREDLETKFRHYQYVLCVKEYFLFDVNSEYLDPPLRGFRLRAGNYRPIRPVDGRLPSQVLGLHLEQADRSLRLYDPLARCRLPTSAEIIEAANASHAKFVEQYEALVKSWEGDESMKALFEMAQTDLCRLRAELERLRRQGD
jgi:Uma2 family endonuclease